MNRNNDVFRPYEVIKTEKSIKELNEIEMNDVWKQFSDNLKQATRDLTYWDIYKFSATVETSDQFQTIINKLLPNTSAIINCDKFIYNEEEYNLGDVIVKKEDGTLLHIRTIDNGIYVPESSGEGKITYSYSPEIPKNAEIAVDIPTFKSDDVYGLIYEREEGEKESWGFEVTSAFVKDKENASIRPILKFFIEQDNKYEEIYCEYTYTYIEVSDNEGSHWVYRIQDIPAIVDRVVVK